MTTRNLAEFDQHGVFLMEEDSLAVIADPLTECISGGGIMVCFRDIVCGAFIPVDVQCGASGIDAVCTLGHNVGCIQNTAC